MGIVLQSIASLILYYFVYVIYAGVTVGFRKNEFYNQIFERLYIVIWLILGIIAISTFTDKALALSVLVGPIIHLYKHFEYHNIIH